MSGIGHTGKFVGRTYDQTIDGVLGNTAWADSVVYYSFPTTKTEYSYSGFSTDISGIADNFSQISTQQKNLAHKFLDLSGGNNADDGFSIEGFTNLTISYTTQ